MNFPGPDKAVFVLDPAAGLTPDGLWKDSGPFGLHWTPTNYAAPNYGLNSDSKGTRYYSFNGANQSASLAGALRARFYQYAPTTEFTFVFAAYFNDPATNDTIFSCTDPANQNGIRVYNNPSGNQIRAIIYRGGVSTYVESTAALPLAQRKRVITIQSIAPIQSTVYRRIYQDTVPVAATVAGTAQAQIGYQNTGVLLGSHIGVALFDGNLYYAAMYPFLFCHAEAVAISQWLRDRL